MASTYVNDLRLNEMATGDASGTWGTVTNTNLELIGEALGFGTEAITTNADTHTSTVADGATDPARAMYIKYTGTLDSACTITIAPNTLNRLHFIENGTSGSQNIIISQGSGANVTIPPGDTKAVYLDGAGSGAAVVDAFASLNVVDLKVEDDLTVTDDATIGGTLGVTGETTLATHLNMGDNDKIKLGASADLEIYHDGSNSIISEVGTGNLDITSNGANVSIMGKAGENSIIATGDGSVELYHDNSKKFETTSTGIEVTGSIVGTTSIIPDGVDGAHLGSTSAEWSDLYLADGGIIYFGNEQDVYLEHVADTGLRFPDNDKLMFGASNDLQIYHDGSNSYVDDTGAGDLILRGNSKVNISKYTGEAMIHANVDSSVDLFFDNTVKLATSAAGVSVFGTLVATKVQGTSGESLTIESQSGGAVIFNSNGANERMRIVSGGNVLVGTTNQSPAEGTGNGVRIGSNGTSQFSSNGDAGLTSNRTGDNGNVMTFRRDGTLVGTISVTGSSTAFNTSSDYRLKENVNYDFDATSRIKELKPCRFNFISDKDATVDGFLAHEVSSIIPEAITGEKDGTQDLGTIKDANGNILSENVLESTKEDGQTWTKTKTENVYQNIDQSKIVPLLVKTIQELEARITTLESA